MFGSDLLKVSLVGVQGLRLGKPLLVSASLLKEETTMGHQKVCSAEVRHLMCATCCSQRAVCEFQLDQKELLL